MLQSLTVLSSFGALIRFTENNVGNRTGNSSSGSAAANVTASKEPSTGVHTTVSSDFVATRAALIDTGHH
ncbi:unnamed protein product [Sphagnum troendelagicum]